MDRSRSAFSEGLRRNFGFEPTASQAEAMDRFADFIYGKGDNFLFQLSGYAGTGKTSLVSALVKTLADIGVHIVMLAPTGRAAIVFVSGKDSSNGKVLCELCRSANIRTWHIGSASGLRREWFRPDDRVGVCGATSTPKWLLEEVATAIKNLQ